MTRENYVNPTINVKMRLAEHWRADAAGAQAGHA
jgi:hypothetical protein